MPGYLEVVTGRFAGTTAVVERGDAVDVGSLLSCRVALPQESGLLPRHFTIVHDRKGIHLVAIGETFVDDEPAQQVLLPSRSWIVAGGTAFLFSRNPAVIGPIPESPLEVFAATLCRGASDLYVMVDFAVAQCSIGAFEGLPERSALLTTTSEIASAQGNPWLFRVPNESKPVLLLLRHFWGQGRLVFFTSDYSMDSICRYFREILLQPRSDRAAAIRFYDPRALRLLLRNANAMQANAIFGPVAEYIVEDRFPSGVLHGKLTTDGCGLDSRSLVANDAAVPANWELASARAESSMEFVRQLASRLAADFPHLRERADLHESVAEAMRRAVAQGYQGAASAAQYVYLEQRLGAGFAVEPAFAAYLSRPEGTPEERLDLLATALNSLDSPANGGVD